MSSCGNIPFPNIMNVSVKHLKDVNILAINEGKLEGLGTSLARHEILGRRNNMDIIYIGSFRHARVRLTGIVLVSVGRVRAVVPK